MRFVDDDSVWYHVRSSPPTQRVVRDEGAWHAGTTHRLLPGVAKRRRRDDERPSPSPRDGKCDEGLASTHVVGEQGTAIPIDRLGDACNREALVGAEPYLAQLFRGQHTSDGRGDARSRCAKFGVGQAHQATRGAMSSRRT